MIMLSSNNVFFLPFQFVYFLLSLLALLHRLVFPLWCPKSVVRGDILLFFLILESKHSGFHRNDVSCRLLWMLVITLRLFLCALPDCAMSFYQEYFVKYFICIGCYDLWFFSLACYYGEIFKVDPASHSLYSLPKTHLHLHLTRLWNHPRVIDLAPFCPAPWCRYASCSKQPPGTWALFLSGTASPCPCPCISGQLQPWGSWLVGWCMFDSAGCAWSSFRSSLCICSSTGHLHHFVSTHINLRVCLELSPPPVCCCSLSGGCGVHMTPPPSPPPPSFSSLILFIWEQERALMCECEQGEGQREREAPHWAEQRASCRAWSQNPGIMTQAKGTLCPWALQVPHVALLFHHIQCGF